MTSKKLLGAAAICAFAALVPLLGRRNADTREAVSLSSFDPESQSNICIALADNLPGSVHSDHDPAFRKSISSYWSLNACEKKPSCIVLPKTVHEVATTVKLLKAEFDRSRNSSVLPRFAVRSGGHSPEAGFASLDGGVVVDMSLLSEIVVSDDRQSASIGVGARWADVSLKLDDMGLAIVKPSCIVLPKTVHEVATTVKLLKAEFDRSRNSSVLPRFAVRSGGHSPEAGFASLDGGVVVDMSLLSEIVVSDDRQSASIGVGARWADVSLKLDDMGLAIVGGRNADVGVGGLVLGGMYDTWAGATSRR
nr:fad-dependent monooxygenase yanf [Quercus suber]